MDDEEHVLRNNACQYSDYKGVAYATYGKKGFNGEFRVFGY